MVRPTRWRAKSITSDGRTMNYRHGFHAGNFADVLKHAAMVGLLDALQAKPGALCCFDTHAGRALYDLHGEQARKTQEHAGGIQRLLGASGLPGALQRYVDLVQAFQPANAAGGSRHMSERGCWISRQTRSGVHGRSMCLTSTDTTFTPQGSV